MSDDAFDLVEQAARSGRSESVFELVANSAREVKNYPQLFEARLMQRRSKLGLPLILTDSLGELPDDKRRAYEDSYVEAAREVGGLFLADGDIPRAWPYFRAIGETAPVAAAIEQIQPREGLEAVIEIAFHERANPRKGFELILANYGTCSAITTFEQYPGRDGREDCVRLLVRKLHGDLIESLRHAITQREGQAPDSRSIPTLIAGRDWLFEENNYHVDTSHLAAVVRFAMELTDRETRALAVELTDYGRCLSPLFHYRGQPPFDNVYVDYGVYLRVLLGDDVDDGISHFRRKLPQAGSDESDTAAAQVLVNLLAQLGRYAEAIDVSVQHLRGVESGQMACPSAVQLCQLAGDRARLQTVARERSDLLSFAAAVVQG